MTDLSLDEIGASWEDPLSMPFGDEQRLGSSERPPKYWLDFEDNSEAYYVGVRITPRWGK